jgi:hydroxyacylglutathione hydrolase
MRETLQVIAIPAFEDNYIWLLHNSTQAIVIDPGDATPVLNALKTLKLHLQAILVTHHHHDHIDGVQALCEKFPNTLVFAPHFPFNFYYTPVNETSSVKISWGESQSPLHFSVLDVPAHTLDHIAYVLNYNEETWLFCGDTLFGAGCGRLFEGKPAQMLAALNKFCQLPESTKIFCTHEYTLKNIQFACTIEPSNLALNERKLATTALREKNLPSLPSTMQLERATNPFLRCHLPTIKKTLRLENATELEVFTQVRMLRNQY